jgi:1-acylglycerone phosphate reductase
MDAETQQKAEVFAKAVVRSILESNGKVEVFKGSLASIAWAITSFGPKWMIVS